MKFSVVITTYNRLNLLRRAIDSALNQTIECEVIVADDCSQDETQAYVKNLSQQMAGLGKSSLVYCRNEVNSGHAATVNAGILKASGDWIKFLDDDDYLALNCLEEMTKAIELCPSAAIVSCVSAQVDSNENELSRTPTIGSSSAYYIPQADIHYGMLLELIPFGTPVQVACRRDAFLQTGGWDSTLDANCDDIDSWVKLTQFGDAIFLNQCLAYRTIWTGAYNQKFSLQKRLDTNILIKKKIYDLVNETYRSQIPAFKDIKNYLQLHWTIVALKQKRMKEFVELLNPGVLSPNAWKLLLSTVFARRINHDDAKIRRLQLI